MLATTTLEQGGSAGYVALLLIVLIGIVTVLLIRNMSGRLKKLPRDFDAPRPGDDGEQPPGGTPPASPPA